MTLQRNRIRAATALAVILSVMPTAASTAWAESESSPKPQSPSAPPTPPTPQSPSLFPFSFPSLSQFQFWDEGFDAHPGYWWGSLEFDFMNGKQSTSSPNTGGSTSSNNAMREKMKIANSGFYILSPKLCTGNMELDLELNQDRSSSSGGGKVTQGNVLGYAVDATFLAEKPYTATVFANRSQNQVLQPFGGRTVGVNENQGALFQLHQDSILKDWGYRWVEANLGIRQDHNRNTTTSFGHSQTNDEKSQTLDFDASKGFETADLAFNYQLNDHSNQVFRQGNFQSQAAGLQYSLDFGPTLNRRFDSKLNFLTRDGSAPSTTISNSEHLHIDHFRNLSTDYQYGFAHQTIGGISTTQQNGVFSVSRQWYNLNTSAGLSGNYNTLPGGTTTAFGGHLGEGYHHSLPGKGNLTLNWSGSYQENSNNLSASNINVIEEAHSAPNPFGAGVGFLLNHNFAVASSIVVINVRGGGRILTGAGVDYDVINENNQIKIVPLAGSLLISPGDPLLVNYNYQVDANLKYATKSTGFGMGVGYGWISAAFNHQQSEQTPLSGTPSLFLQNTRQDSVQVNLQGTVLEMAANAGMDFANFKSTTSAYARSKLGSTLTWEIQSNMRMNFSVNASETQYTVPDQRKNSSRSARSSLDWFTWSGWNNTASVDWSNNKDSGTPAETLIQAIGQSSITLGQLSLKANLALGEWLRNGSRSTNRSFNISIVRQF